MQNKTLLIETKNIFIQLLKSIHLLDYDQYKQPIEILVNSSIGQHTRHIIEFYQILLSNYHDGTINYDNRNRNQLIESNINYASECIAHIISELNKPDKPLRIISLYNNQEEMIESCYYRELLYNIEHCIHHQAIIKIGFIALKINSGDETFGISKSTIIFKKKCVKQPKSSIRSLR